MMPEVRQDRSALRWIRGELDQTLSAARASLEDFVDGQQDQLQGCVDNLHHVHGALDMVQVYGGAMLADEMEQLAMALSQGQVKRVESAAEALMLGLVQLPAYLEKVENGAADAPLALLPLMNDLRSTRDAPLISETSLFAPKLNAVIAADTVRPGSGNRELPALIQQHRSLYHRALLGFIRGQDTGAALRQIRDLLDVLNSAAGTARFRRLLDAAEALAAALLDDDATPALAVKPLFGKLDRIFKQIIDQGEEAAMLDFPVDLLKNLLYYVARSNSQDAAVEAVRQAADLANAFPEQGGEDSASGPLGGPDRELFDAVGEALSQDLRDVKDQLDLFMRSDRSQLARLTGLAQPIQRIGDTLGMVGRGELRTRLKRRCDELRAAEAAGEVPADDRLMALAGDLLFVESSLASLGAGDQALGVDAPADGEAQSLSEGELKLHQRAAVDEALVELAKTKEAILGYLDRPQEPAPLNEIPARLHNVAGVLKMLALPEAGEILAALKPYVSALASGEQPVPDTAQRDALADVVISAELYMHSAIEPGGDRAKLLAVADAGLRRLGLRETAVPMSIVEGTAQTVAESAPDDDAQDTAAVTPSSELEPATASPEPEAEAAAQTIETDGLTAEAVSEAAAPPGESDQAEQAGDAAEPPLDQAAMPIAEAPAEQAHTAVDEPPPSPGEEPVAQAQAAPSAAPPGPSEEVDSEILEIFGEEAAEELQVIQECYPRWRDDQADGESLQTMRRSFHTLKGSGRIVGAMNLGEFAWSVENLLNRVIDGTVTVSPELLGLMDEVIEILPTLVAESAHLGSPGTDVSALSERAFAMAAGAPVEPTATQATAAAPSEPSAAAGSMEAEEPAGTEPEAPAQAAAADEEATELTVEWPEEAPPIAQIDALAESGEPEETPADPGLIGEAAPPDEPAEPAAADAAETAELLEDAAEQVADESILTATEAEDSQLTAPAATTDEAADSSLDAVFVDEARGHLNVLGEFIARCGAEPANCVLDEGVRRAMHTLCGSARTAGVASMAELASALERLSNVMSSSQHPADPATLELLGRSHAMLSEMAPSIEGAHLEVPGWEALRDEINRLADALAHPAVEPEQADAGQAAEPYESLDPELLEVFLEEAKELLEALEGELAEWQASAIDDHQPVVRLQRTLHTMKGGSRLSGVTSVGDLSHALESVFESLTERRVAGSERLRDLVRHACDALAQDIDVLMRGSMPAPHPAMIGQLEAAAHGREWQDPSVGEQGPGGALRQPAADQADEASDAATAAEPAGDEAQPAGGFAAQPAAPEVPAPVEKELAVDARPAAVATGDLDDDLDVDSELLADSQLMTDSELLEDSNLLISASDAAAQSGSIGTLVGADSKVVQFPSGDQFGEGDGFVARRPQPHEEATPTGGSERVRVSSEVLDQMVNNAGEVSIYRARLEQQNSSFAFNLGEFGQTTDRLRAQLRDLEMETEAQILSRHEREGDARSDFDPLELDRYSTMQQLSRALSETVEDLSNLQQTLSELSRDNDTLLLQQARVTADLQDSLMRTRMVKFASRVPRLERVVRQTCHTLGKQARLDVAGGREDMDRAILERMMGPLEHLLRNAVSHGIEDVNTRQAKGKPAQGVISLKLAREGSDIVLRLSDDGAGLDRERIRAKAVDRGLIEPSATIEDDDLYQLILQPGFSTAQALSQVSGRGVGMDVVLTEVKQLGGTLEIASEPGRSTSFTIRLPFTLAITDSLLVTLGDDIYAVPHSSMDGVVRIPLEDLRAIYAGEQERFEYGGREYVVRYLGSMLGSQAPHLSEGTRWLPLLLVRSGEHRVAIQVDGLLGNRQIVVKSVGAQLSTVRWFTGGTILADGQIALILDVNSLVRMDSAQQPAVPVEAEEPLNKGVSVMVVDDSITVRKVTSRLLERHNMQVITAKDGVDAVTQLQEHRPDVMLLDIEMPRMDGYELARHMRSTPELSDIPIIMITSRTGDKHRNRAVELGVKRYLGKPYQEAELLENIYTVLADSAL